jgi:AcrR family transcriptional regulator
MSMTHGGRPSKDELESLENHLLDAAESMFLSKGFAGTSLDKLSVVARISKRTIYHRYATKEDLFAAVIERVAKRLFEDDVLKARGATIEERLEHLAVHLADRALRPEVLALMRVVIADAHRFEALAHAVDLKGRQHVIATIAAFLSAECQTEDLVLRETPEAAADQFLGLVQGTLTFRALTGRALSDVRAEAPAFARSAARLFLEGCRTRRHDPSSRDGTRPTQNQEPPCTAAPKAPRAIRARVPNAKPRRKSRASAQSAAN